MIQLWIWAIQWDPKYWRGGEGGTLPLGWLVRVLGGILVLLVLYWFYQRICHVLAHRGPMRLFMAIARDLGLRTNDALLLYRIARECGLPSPVTLVASHTTLRHYAEQYVQRRSARQRQIVRRQIDAIDHILFDEDR